MATRYTLATTAQTQTLTNKTLTSPTIDIKSPQGFLLNGKIEVTDASGITVEIKGLDGNDPSASNPVYCRIGDTVRSITAALSVVKADGTNWCDAGSTELATKEIDYFVYLGYNATDGVVLGFSRIVGYSYDDFHATTTNEKYCAISTITNAAATDYYNVIGRFAATLSAGAGYTWTVPTFTAKNLIQRPIYETRWLEWSPTYTGVGSLTFTSVTENIKKYKITENSCIFQLESVGTTGGTTDCNILATVAFSSSLNRGNFACRVSDGVTYSGSAQFEDDVDKITHKRYDGGDWGLGSGRRIASSGVYEI